ncbi:MAG TPA: rhomboid family intramembrane serine protease [Thermoanaerobaculia bacterium]|nr:rhomboid family intramembrane serine protease [Thermoanaerobaculia bacterium]
MLLIPIGRDEAEIRRHAWVSYAIIALNVIAFVATGIAMRRSAMESVAGQWESAFNYYAARPYLEPPPELDAAIPDEAREELEAAAPPAGLPHADTVEAEQEELDTLVAEAVAARAALPYLRFGYIPAEGRVHTLFTSMFLHAGLLHLLGNLLFFYFSGPFVEDVFGRPLFAALYFAGGVVAALTFAARDAAGTTPLVGASGAIAAVMGAYLFRFYRSKIELLFVPFLWRPTFNFRFFVPAFVVLPLWFVQQLFEMQSEAGSGVAFSAHVGGFVFGFLFAACAAAVGFEQKYVEPKVTEETTWKMDDRLAEGIAARRRGDDVAAKAALKALLRDQPQNGDALRIVLDIALEEKDWATVDPAAARLLSAHIAEQDAESARDLIIEVGAHRTARLPKFLARAAAYAERSGDRDRALVLYQRLYEAEPNAPGSVATLVKTSALLRASGERDRAREALERARAHPACTPEWARTIDERAAVI